MTWRLQYQVWAVTDPEGLGDPLRDEIQWWAELSVPVLPPVDLSSVPSTFIDPVALDEQPPEVVTLDEFRPLSEPVLPLPLQHPPASTIDPLALDAPEDTRLTWYAEFSLPVLPVPQTRVGWFDIDPATLGAALRDEIQWWAELSRPSPPPVDLASIPSFVIDPTSLADPAVEIVTLDEFRQLDLPIFVRPIQQPDAAITDPETLDDPLRDELQWFQPLSEPAQLPQIAYFAGGVSVETVEPAPSLDTSLEDWYQPLSEPVLPPLEPAFFLAGDVLVDLQDIEGAEEETVTGYGYTPYAVYEPGQEERVHRRRKRLREERRKLRRQIERLLSPERETPAAKKDSGRPKAAVPKEAPLEAVEPTWRPRQIDYEAIAQREAQIAGIEAELERLSEELAGLMDRRRQQENDDLLAILLMAAD